MQLMRDTARANNGWKRPGKTKEHKRGAALFSNNKTGGGLLNALPVSCWRKTGSHFDDEVEVIP